MTFHSSSALDVRLNDDLVATSYPDIDWVRPVAGPDGQPALDCAVIGAGQMGLTIAAGLKRECVGRVALFDRATAGFEGPWLTFARMQTLRTPKFVTGTELGLPSLGFRAWWIARHGQEGWDSLGRIPRTAWMDYLVWYRHAMGLDVRNGHDLQAISPRNGGLFRLLFATPAGSREVYARTVVLATGSEGGGGHIVPTLIANAVPPEQFAHTNDTIDFAPLVGKRIGILGAGASAFDTAIAALEAGAASVDLCFRRESLPQENPRRWMESSGFLASFGAFSDELKWRYMHRLYTIGQPPPLPTFERAMSFPTFRMQAGTPWDTCRTQDKVIEVRSGDRTFTFDFVVAGTGISVDLGLRRELDELRPQLALWQDRFMPPADLRHGTLSSFPYLGRHGEFTEREQGAAPYLQRICFLARPATLSLGPVAASNSALKYVGPRVIRHIVQTLSLDQTEADWQHFMSIKHFERPVETKTFTRTSK